MKKTIVLALAAMFAAGSAMAQQPVQQQKNNGRPGVQRNMRPASDTVKSDGQSAMRLGGPDSRMHRHGGPHAKHQHCQKQCQQKPAELQYNALGIETTLAKAFPEAKSAKKTDKWTEVMNAKGKVIGYGVYSKPASNGIKGFNGETPVLITLNAKKKITGVYALPNMETPRFQQRVEETGFFNNWNGLSIKQAKKKKVDAVSGATFTSRAVAQSVQAALEKL